MTLTVSRLVVKGEEWTGAQSLLSGGRSNGVRATTGPRLETTFQCIMIFATKHDIEIEYYISYIWPKLKICKFQELPLAMNICQIDVIKRLVQELIVLKCPLSSK